jgi:hypothetical protein
MEITSVDHTSCLLTSNISHWTITLCVLYSNIISRSSLGSWLHFCCPTPLIVINICNLQVVSYYICNSTYWTIFCWILPYKRNTSKALKFPVKGSINTNKTIISTVQLITSQQLKCKLRTGQHLNFSSKRFVWVSVCWVHRLNFYTKYEELLNEI